MIIVEINYVLILFKKIIVFFGSLFLVLKMEVRSCLFLL